MYLRMPIKVPFVRKTGKCDKAKDEYDQKARSFRRVPVIAMSLFFLSACVAPLPAKDNPDSNGEDATALKISDAVTEVSEENLSRTEQKKEIPTSSLFDGFQSSVEELGFDFYDVSHMYSESRLLGVGLAERKDGSQLFCFCYDSGKPAELKIAELIEPFGENMENAYDGFRTEMAGTRYVIGKNGKEVYFAIAPDSVDYETMVSWMKLSKSNSDNDSMILWRESNEQYEVCFGGIGWEISEDS